MKKLSLLAALLVLFAVFPLIAQDADITEAEFYYNRGLENYYKGELDRAIADWTEAIRLKPDYTEAYYNRGVAYNAKGELDLVIENYTMAITLNPNWAYPWHNRGLAYYARGELDRAIDDYTMAH